MCTCTAHILVSVSRTSVLYVAQVRRQVRRVHRVRSRARRAARRSRCRRRRRAASTGRSPPAARSRCSSQMVRVRHAGATQPSLTDRESVSSCSALVLSSVCEVRRVLEASYLSARPHARGMRALQILLLMLLRSNLK